MKRISFVVPVFRNEGTILRTAGEIAALMRRARPALGYEILFVDDGSDDGSAAEIRKAAEADPRVGWVGFSRNFGQVAALVEGFRRAKGDAAVMLSADLQDPIELVERMIESWEKGHGVVVGYRTRRDDGVVAGVTSRIFYGLMRRSLPSMPAGGFDFLLLDRRPLDVLNSFGGRNRFLQGDVMWLGFPTAFLPYERRPRPTGRSQWSLGMKVKYFLDGLLSTAYWPIRLMSLLGILTALAGFAWSAIIVASRLAGGVMNQPGWAPIMIAVLLIGGLLMMMLGIIGEYVWRIHDEVRGRPPSAVREFVPPSDGGGPPPKA